jgi:hypothetical protein
LEKAERAGTLTPDEKVFMDGIHARVKLRIAADKAWVAAGKSGGEYLKYDDASQAERVLWYQQQGEQK